MWHYQHKKLQRIQNKGTLFISDVRLSDRISSRELHARLKLDPMNIHISKLSHKLMYTIHKIYCIDDDFLSQHINCFSQSLAKIIIDNIYNDPTQCPWFNPPDIHDWISPQPVFA